jgi:hypothetical protein
MKFQLVLIVLTGSISAQEVELTEGDLLAFQKDPGAWFEILRLIDDNPDVVFLRSDQEAKLRRAVDLGMLIEPVDEQDLLEGQIALLDSRLDELSKQYENAIYSRDTERMAGLEHERFLKLDEERRHLLSELGAVSRARGKDGSLLDVIRQQPIVDPPMTDPDSRVKKVQSLGSSRHFSSKR